jgi:hypothetical protein
MARSRANFTFACYIFTPVHDITDLEVVISASLDYLFNASRHA